MILVQIEHHIENFLNIKDKNAIGYFFFVCTHRLQIADDTVYVEICSFSRFSMRMFFLLLWFHVMSNETKV